MRNRKKVLLSSPFIFYRFFKRNQQERNILYDYLKKFNIFSFFSESFLERITLKINAEFYEEGKTSIVDLDNLNFMLSSILSHKSK